MKNSKNKRTIILVIILIGLLILAYKIMFVSDNSSAEGTIDENVIATQRVEAVLNQIQSINFDTSVMENQNFKSLQSIDMPNLSLPIGRKNPFAGTSNSSASATVLNSTSKSN